MSGSYEQLKMSRFSLGVTRMDKITNEYVRRAAHGMVWRKHKRQDWSGLDMYGGKMMGILGKGCREWSCQERGHGEGQKGGLWMWWKRTWLRLKWRRRIQKIGTNGDGQAAVATTDWWSQKKKKCFYDNPTALLTWAPTCCPARWPLLRLSPPPFTFNDCMSSTTEYGCCEGCCHDGCCCCCCEGCCCDDWVVGGLT